MHKAKQYLLVNKNIVPVMHNILYYLYYIYIYVCVCRGGSMGGGARGGKAHPKFLESSILTFIVIIKQ